MNTIIVADIMLLVGDQNRGCKLADICYETFGASKIQNEKVSYENLCQTWKSGNGDDLCLLIGYCLRDVVLLYMLAKAKDIMLFNATISMETGLQLREIFGERSVKTVCSLFYKYGYLNDIVLSDTNKYSSPSINIWPSFDVEKDFDSLPQCGGRSVQNVGWFDSWQVTFDFSSQYPSIMIGRNICLSSNLDKTFIVKNNLKEDKDYIRVTVPNVCEVIRKQPDCTENTEDSETRIVHKDIFYATETFFRGYCNTISVKLKEKRQKYKTSAESERDPNEKLKNKTREQALKILCNSVYGVILKMKPSVGGSITQLARTDIANVSKQAKAAHNYAVVTGDTDSVFLTILNKKNTANFSSMCKALCMPVTSHVKDIVLRVYKKADNFANMANTGCEAQNMCRLYPAPSRICVEKVFPSILISAKKCYIGCKLMPGDLSLKLHVAGISGKKADSTPMKTNSQILIYKMMLKKDLNGLIMFMKHLFKFCSWELHVENIIEDRKKVLADAGDQEGFFHFVRNLSQYRKSLYSGNIPLNLLTSFEKVGDLHKMDTVTAKKAYVYCFENGIALHNAPMFIPMQRGSNVQVSNFMKSIIEIILSGPCLSDKHQLNETLRSDVYTSWKKHERKMPDRKIQNTLSKQTKLQITTMPLKYVSKAEDRVSIDGKAYLEFMKLLVEIIDTEKRLKLHREAIRQNKEEHDAVTPSFLFEDAFEKQNALERLLYFIQNASNVVVHPPSYMFDPGFAISRLCNLSKVSKYCYSTMCQSVLLWHLYIDHMETNKESKRFIVLGMDTVAKGLKISFTDEYLPNFREFRYDMNSLNSANSWKIDDGNTQYILDMHSYRNQTRSTPLVVESYDGTGIYLTNHDSYIQSDENSFSFRIKFSDILKIMLVSFKEPDMSSHEVLKVENVLHKPEIKITLCNNVIHIPVIKILRDDNIRCMERWLWEMKHIFVNAAWFFKIIRDVAQNMPTYIDIKYFAKKHCLEMLTNSKEARIHATDGSSEPKMYQLKNAFEILMRSSTRKRKLQNLVSFSKKAR